MILCPTPQALAYFGLVTQLSSEYSAVMPLDVFSNHGTKVMAAVRRLVTLLTNLCTKYQYTLQHEACILPKTVKFLWFKVRKKVLQCDLVHGFHKRRGHIMSIDTLHGLAHNFLS